MANFKKAPNYALNDGANLTDALALLKKQANNTLSILDNVVTNSHFLTDAAASGKFVGNSHFTQPFILALIKKCHGKGIANMLTIKGKKHNYVIACDTFTITACMSKKNGNICDIINATDIDTAQAICNTIKTHCFECVDATKINELFAAENMANNDDDVATA